MFLIFFLISFLFSLAPQTLLLPMENILDPSIKKMTAKTPSYSRFLKLSLDSNNKRFLNLTPPSFYLSRFQNRIDQTKAWAQTKQYKGILKHLESKIPTGSFSKPQVVELQNGPHLGERFVFIKPELTSRHKGTLYSQKPLKERKQIQQFYKKMEDKFLLNQIPSPQMMRVHSFDSIMTSQFQFLIEIFEHRPYLWTTLSSQQQVSLLLLLSQTLILSNEYSIAKRIAFFLEHFCYSFLTSTQRGMIPFLIDGLFPSVIFQFVDSKYLPYNFTSLHSSFKHRWMSLCRYQGIAPITYTWQDFNLVPLLDGDLIDYLSSHPRQSLFDGLSSSLVPFLTQLSQQHIVQTDAFPDNILFSSKSGKLKLYVTDFDSVFSEVHPNDTLIQFNIISSLCIAQLIDSQPPACDESELDNSDKLDTSVLFLAYLRRMTPSSHPKMFNDFQQLIAHSLSKETLNNPDSFLGRGIICSHVAHFHYKFVSLFFTYSPEQQNLFNYTFGYRLTPDEMTVINRPFVILLAFINKVQLSCMKISIDQFCENLYYLHQFCLLMYQNPGSQLYYYFVNPQESLWLNPFQPVKSMQLFLQSIKPIYEQAQFYIECYKTSIIPIQDLLSNHDVPPMFQVLKTTLSQPNSHIYA